MIQPVTDYEPCHHTQLSRSGDIPISFCVSLQGWSSYGDFPPLAVIFWLLHEIRIGSDRVGIRLHLNNLFKKYYEGILFDGFLYGNFRGLLIVRILRAISSRAEISDGAR